MRTALLTCLVLLLTVVYADEEECTADDGTCNCEDSAPDCVGWAKVGECETNAAYMIQNCPQACNFCGDDKKEECKDLDPNCSELVDDGEFENNPVFMFSNCAKSCNSCDDGKKGSTTTTEEEDCQDLQPEECPEWAEDGECEANPDYVLRNCAKSCGVCGEQHCPVDSDITPNAWEAGDLNTFFDKLTTEFEKYEPTILSKPQYSEDHDEETADYIIGPWVVTLENFITDEEADRLIQLGEEKGYEYSSSLDNASKVDDDDKFENNTVHNTMQNSGRDGSTTSIAWCAHACYNDPVSQQVTKKMEEITSIPETNYEYLQLTKYYDVGQQQSDDGTTIYHDYVDFQIDRQPGVRILTIFIFLNDVEVGGDAHFPRLDISVEPKKGRAIVYPLVLDGYPHVKSFRTDHESFPLRKKGGIKYGVNTFIHQRDFKTPPGNGGGNDCQA